MADHIERELELPASIEEAWRAMTEPTWLSAWLADEVALELWPGGEARFTIGEKTRIGWVEEVSEPVPGDEGRAGRLAFWWGGDDEPASRVELILTAGKRGTVLRVSETRPLEVLDLVGVPLPGQGGARFGPALVAA